MIKYIQQYLLILLLIVAGPAFATQPYSLPGADEEKVILFTDRSIYITGEQIYFSASIFNTRANDTSGQSHILYCELVTPGGNIVSNRKFLINKSLAEGCIIIPEDQVTGIYYIRAYTKLMRKNGPLSYGYKQIKIVNPYRTEVLASDSNQNLSAGEITQTRMHELNNLISVFADKTVYTPRDTINLSYQLVNTANTAFKSLCLSVVPENSRSSASFQPSTKEPVKVEAGYYPETRGLSLIGKLTEASSTIPVSDKKINLSIIGEGRDFMSARTDSLGRFYFALPDYYGTRDLFLCAEKTPMKTVKIWVDNDFCTTPFRLPSPLFSLSEQERLTAQNMAQNMQINSYFRSLTLPDSLPSKKEEYSFYGKPTTILNIDKYIMLPTLEEYFNELPSQVKVRKRKGESYFVVQGSADLSFYDPLVLVDWVAVDEPSKILAVSPQNISHIEVVNEDYVKGGQTYGGIISIISKKGDFAGINLPSTGIFINYRFLAENQCHEQTLDNVTSHPDTRNTILWNPELKVPKTQPEKIIFIAPDTPGKYSVVFEGVTANGEIFSVTSEFEVTN
jgi:hypothetical protein